MCQTKLGDAVGISFQQIQKIEHGAKHGNDAAIHAAMRSDELLDAGDPDGAATWRRVIQAIKELESTIPGGVVH